MNWKKVEPSNSDVWKPENQGDTIQGKYKTVKQEVGQNESNLYLLETEEGEYGVWGSAVIDSRMSEVPLGSMVKIVYKGKATGEKSGREYKDFDIFIGVEEDDDDVDVSDIPL